MVGAFDPGNTSEHAFLWTKKAGMLDLGTLGGPFSVANGINDQGVVAGYAHTGQRVAGFVWTKTDGMQDLGSLSGGDTFAEGINQTGDIAGSRRSREPTRRSHAVLWPASGGILDLGQLSQFPDDSMATAINNSNQIVGLSDMGNNTNHAFLWTSEFGMQDLGTLTVFGATQGESTTVKKWRGASVSAPRATILTTLFGGHKQAACKTWER